MGDPMKQTIEPPFKGKGKKLKLTILRILLQHGSLTAMEIAQRDGKEQDLRCRKKRSSTYRKVIWGPKKFGKTLMEEGYVESTGEKMIRGNTARICKLSPKGLIASWFALDETERDEFAKEGFWKALLGQDLIEVIKALSSGNSSAESLLNFLKKELGGLKLASLSDEEELKEAVRYIRGFPGLMKEARRNHMSVYDHIKEKKHDIRAALGALFPKAASKLDLGRDIGYLDKFYHERMNHSPPNGNLY